MLLRKFEELVLAWKDGDELEVQLVGEDNWVDSYSDNPKVLMYEDIIKHEYRIKGDEPEYYTAYELAGYWLVSVDKFMLIGSDEYDMKKLHAKGWSWVSDASDIRVKEEWRSLKK